MSSFSYKNMVYGRNDHSKTGRLFFSTHPKYRAIIQGGRLLDNYLRYLCWQTIMWMLDWVCWWETSWIVLLLQKHAVGLIKNSTRVASISELGRERSSRTIWKFILTAPFNRVWIGFIYCLSPLSFQWF